MLDLAETGRGKQPLPFSLISRFFSLASLNSGYVDLVSDEFSGSRIVRVEAQTALELG